ALMAGARKISKNRSNRDSLLMLWGGGGNIQLPSRAHQEHAFSCLGYAVISRVEDPHLRDVSQPLSPFLQRVSHGLPPLIHGKSLNVLHHESLRPDPIHHIQKSPNVLTAGIVGVHASSH